MNYRQWKKNYKKVHGYNPPIEADKRKQAKQVARFVNLIRDIDFVSIINSLKEAMTRAFDCISERLKSMAKNFRGGEEK